MKFTFWTIPILGVILIVEKVRNFFYLLFKKKPTESKEYSPEWLETAQFWDRLDEIEENKKE